MDGQHGTPSRPRVMTSPVTNPNSLVVVPIHRRPIYPAAGSHSDPRRGAGTGMGLAARRGILVAAASRRDAWSLSWRGRVRSGRPATTGRDRPAGRRRGARAHMRGFGAVAGQDSGSPRSHIRSAAQQQRDVKKRERNGAGLRQLNSAQLSSPLLSYNDRIRLLDRMCVCVFFVCGRQRERVGKKRRRRNFER